MQRGQLPQTASLAETGGSQSAGDASELPIDKPVGRHLLADLYGMAPDRLRDEAWLLEVFTAALDRAGFNTIGVTSHKFPGAASGVTAVALLSESHASFHTYPEHEYVALDVFSCGQPNPQQVVEQFVAALAPQTVECHLRTRGARRDA